MKLTARVSTCSRILYVYEVHVFNQFLSLHKAVSTELLFSHSPISSPSSPMSLTLSSPAIVTQAGSANLGSSAGMGSKRGRLLIRQQRVKKDGDQGGDLETPEAGAYADYLLTVQSSGARMERHASEPSPATSGLSSMTAVSGQNLLSVPSHSSYLVKQHSHPLLPSQSPSTSYTLTRQLSYPTQTMSQTQAVVSTVTTQDIAASGQLLQLQHHKPPVRSHTMPHYSVAEMELGSSDKSQMTSSPTVVIIPDVSADPMNNVQHSAQVPPHQKQSQHHLQLPSIRVKSEELQRSVSSPLVNSTTILWSLKINILQFRFPRHRPGTTCLSRLQRVQAIAQRCDQVQHLDATSVGTRLTLTDESYVVKRNITVPSVRLTCALCHASKNTTNASRQKEMTHQHIQTKRVH